MAHDAHSKIPGSKLSERRFTAEPTGRGNIRALLAGLGAAALGAGSYAAWMSDVVMPAAPYLFVAGAVGAIAASLMGQRDSAPLRVGDAGVAVERGGAPERIGWYEIQNVSIDADGRVVVEGPGKRLSAPPEHHGQASAWIVKEALRRVPQRVTIAADRAAQLAARAESAAEVLALEAPQVAGRRCKASGVIIAFEEDGRVCPSCGEVYDKRHVPEQCLTCGAAQSRAA